MSPAVIVVRFGAPLGAGAVQSSSSESLVPRALVRCGRAASPLLLRQSSGAPLRAGTVVRVPCFSSHRRAAQSGRRYSRPVEVARAARLGALRPGSSPTIDCRHLSSASRRAAHSGRRFCAVPCAVVVRAARLGALRPWGPCLDRLLFLLTTRRFRAGAGVEDLVADCALPSGAPLGAGAFQWPSACACSERCAGDLLWIDLGAPLEAGAVVGRVPARAWSAAQTLGGPGYPDWYTVRFS